MTLQDIDTELELYRSYMKGVFIPLKAYQLFGFAFPAHHIKAFNGEGMRVWVFNSQIPSFEEWKQTPFWINSKSYLGMKINF